MKRLILAVMFAAMAAFGTDARADNVTINNTQSSGLIFFLPTHFESATAFTDTINFSGVSGLNSVEVFFDANINITNFTSATLFSGPGFATSTLLSGIPGTSFTLSPTFLTGPLRLVVQGIPGTLNPGQFASYQAHLNVTAVPEPASLMLLGAGLAGIGIWRRKAAR